MQAGQALIQTQFDEHTIRAAREWTPIKRCKMWMVSRTLVATLAVSMLLGCNKEKLDVRRRQKSIWLGVKSLLVLSGLKQSRLDVVKEQ